MKAKIFLAAIATTLAAVPALSEAPVNRTAVVSYADLDLSTKSGQAKLDRRISRAATNVCGTASSVDLSGQNDVARCIDETRAAVAGEVKAAVATAKPSGKIAIAAAR